MQHLAVTIEQNEGPPTSYPVLSPVVPAEVWQRIESYIAYRFTPRAVVWVVQGPGHWKSPLVPSSISTFEIWNDTTLAYEAVTVEASPFDGYELRGCGPYRFTATVGNGMTCPAIVATAAQRLAVYMASKPGTPGAKLDRINAGSIEIYRTRDASWMAQAMQNSGAADLLRQYRKA